MNRFRIFLRGFSVVAVSVALFSAVAMSQQGLTNVAHAAPTQRAVIEDPPIPCPMSMQCTPGTVLLIPPKEYLALKAKGQLNTVQPSDTGYCAALATMGKTSSHSGSVQGYTTCTVAVVYIEQEVSGQHCTLYLFGGCDVWQPGVWYAPEYPCESSTPAYQADCPSNGGVFTWNNISSGWLVRSDDYSCADFYGEGLACGESASYQVQY